MKFQQSATPYIILFFLLIIGIPLLNVYLEHKLENQVITIQVPTVPVAEKAISKTNEVAYLNLQKSKEK